MTRARRLASRLTSLVRPKSEDQGRYPVWLQYPVHPEPRYGYGRPAHPELDRIIGERSDAYAAQLSGFLPYVDQLGAVALSDPGNGEPFWTNDWLTGLDAVALYGFLAQRNPRTYLEVGSGSSTKFARRAISDHGLQTAVVSIDPAPRSDVDRLCDRVIRQPLEEVDVGGVLATLQAGDIVFLDGSHQCFMNSDVTVAFTELIPRLPPGVLVHVHDIFLPWDYPPGMKDWMYAEQYLLASWLLAGGDRLRIVLPNFYVCLVPDLHRILAPLWDRLVWSATATNGTGFWFECT